MSTVFHLVCISNGGAPLGLIQAACISKWDQLHWITLLVSIISNGGAPLGLIQAACMSKWDQLHWITLLVSIISNGGCLLYTSDAADE